MNSFVDVDFEPGMVLLIDTLEHCIANKKHGWIQKKSGIFNVSFVFHGLKKSVKRKAAVNTCDTSNKVQKLNISLENLLLDIDATDSNLAATHSSELNNQNGQPQTTNIGDRKRQLIENQIDCDEKDQPLPKK